MQCPFCRTPDTKVIDSRLVGDGLQVRRRRECIACQGRFTTYESVELVMPHIVKSDHRREAFNENKLRAGMQRAFEKRPVSTEQLEDAIANIKHLLHACGEREIASHQLGEWAMDEIRKLDKVAYVRFASVYRSFEDINAFQEEIKRLENNKT